MTWRGIIVNHCRVYFSIQRQHLLLVMHQSNKNQAPLYITAANADDITIMTKDSMPAINWPRVFMFPKRIAHIPTTFSIKTPAAIAHEGGINCRNGNSRIAMPLIPPNIETSETNIPEFSPLTERRTDIAISKIGKNSKLITGPTRPVTSATKDGLKIGNAYKNTKTIVKARLASNKTPAARRAARAW